MRRHYNDKKNLILAISILLVLFIGVGYALISTKLTVSTTAITKAASWDIHFANVQVDPKSVTADDPTINDTLDEVSFEVTLPEP